MLVEHEYAHDRTAQTVALIDRKLCKNVIFASGLYLWEHILEGPLNPTDKVAQWREGELLCGKIDFR